jgi:hypothetical protein
MTSPSSPIDADLSPFSNDVYYVLENEGIYKTTNLTIAGAATWEQVWDSDDFDGSEFGDLLRIKCANREDLIYVLGWGYDDSNISKAFVLKSQDAGASWTQYWVAEIDDPEDGSIEYIGTKCDWASYGDSIGAGVKSDGSIVLIPNTSCAASGDTDACCKQFLGQMCSGIFKLRPPVDEEADSITIEFDVNGSFPSKEYNNDGDAYPWCGGNNCTAYLGFTQSTLESVYGDPLTTHANGTLDHRYVQDIIAIGWCWGKPGRWGEWDCGKESPCVGCDGIRRRSGEIKNLVIDGISYNSAYASKGFDTARSEPDWLYVGLLDKVMKSEDGAETWEELITDHGAYDICVDPQAAGAIYYWDTDGELRLNVAGADQGSLLSDSSFNQHGRLARDLNSGRLWAITADGEIKMRNLGSWTTQYEDNVANCGLRAYLDGSLIVLANNVILYSSDYGETWSDKTGDWSDYANPKTANLMDNSL